VTILFGLGGGIFDSAFSMPSGILPAAIISEDFTGDTIEDIAVINQGSGNVWVFECDGVGNFISTDSFLLGLYPSELAGADFNGDQKLDLACANYMSNNISILLQCGPLTLSEEQGHETFAIYPNPCDGIFNLQSQDGVVARIQVTNSFGESVYFGIKDNNDNRIDLSSQPNGIYFVNVISEGETFTQKIVIQK
jgi:hypothetical protein